MLEGAVHISHAYSTEPPATYAIQDWTYRNREFAGPGWYLVGDAAAFVDPILSSGLNLAHNCGLLAANAINTEWNHPDVPVAAVRAGYASLYREIYASFLAMATWWYERRYRAQRLVEGRSGAVAQPLGRRRSFRSPGVLTTAGYVTDFRFINVGAGGFGAQGLNYISTIFPDEPIAESPMADAGRRHTPDPHPIATAFGRTTDRTSARIDGGSCRRSSSTAARSAYRSIRASWSPEADDEVLLVEASERTCAEPSPISMVGARRTRRPARGADPVVSTRVPLPDEADAQSVHGDLLRLRQDSAAAHFTPRPDRPRPADLPIAAAQPPHRDYRPSVASAPVASRYMCSFFRPPRAVLLTAAYLTVNLVLLERAAVNDEGLLVHYTARPHLTRSCSSAEGQTRPERIVRAAGRRCVVTMLAHVCVSARSPRRVRAQLRIPSAERPAGRRRPVFPWRAAGIANNDAIVGTALVLPSSAGPRVRRRTGAGLPAGRSDAAAAGRSLAARGARRADRAGDRRNAVPDRVRDPRRLSPRFDGPLSAVLVQPNNRCGARFRSPAVLPRL